MTHDTIIITNVTFSPAYSYNGIPDDQDKQITDLFAIISKKTFSRTISGTNSAY